MQKLLSYVRRCVDDYHMIEDGDKIAVGVSGGKDSLTLLYALSGLRRFYPKHFDIVAITLDMGFEGADFSEVQKLCDELGIPYILKKTQLKEIIFDIRKESNPCSLCAKMRRGALHDTALENGCKKIALGHHFDDAIETHMLSLFYEGRINCFLPVTYLDRKGVTLIRPMLYTSERYIKSFSRRISLPIVHNPCPANGNTKRQEIKDLLFSLEKGNPGLRERIFGAIQRYPLRGWDVASKNEKIEASSDAENDSY